MSPKPALAPILMIYEQKVSAYTRNQRGKLCRVEFILCIDYEALHLSGRDSNGAFSASFENFSDLQQDYNARAAGLFNNDELSGQDCIEGGWCRA